MSVELAEKRILPPFNWGGSVDETEWIDPESERFDQAKVIHVGDLALREAEVLLPDDLCDLTEVHAQYSEFVRSVTPRDENEIAEPQATKHDSLYDMLYGAAEGKAESRAGVDMNAETIVAEHILKDGSVIEVEAEMSEDGQIVQFGQTTRARQQKTLEWYPNQSSILSANTLMEGRNTTVIENLWGRGELKGRKVLELSLVPMASSKELYNYGYFLDRMTAIPRLTEIGEDGKVKIESGLVGGVDQDVLPPYKKNETLQIEMTRYEVALKQRFDNDVAGEMLEILGVEGARHMSTTEKLGAVVVLPAEVDIVDILQLWDRLASAKLGKPVFYGLRTLYNEFCKGRTPTREDYLAQRQRSKEQRADLKSTARAVADETIRRRAEARNDLQAIRLLAEVAKNYVTRYVVERPNVDARIVIGREAAIWAAEARTRLEWGDLAGAEHFVTKAQQDARPTGCPSGGSSNGPDKSSSERGKLDRNKNDDDGDKMSDLFKKKARSREKNGKKTEWMRCVHCPLCNKDGVDARIDYYPEEKIKRITCTSCRGHKEYDM